MFSVTNLLHKFVYNIESTSTAAKCTQVALKDTECAEKKNHLHLDESIVALDETVILKQQNSSVDINFVTDVWQTK